MSEHTFLLFSTQGRIKKVTLCNTMEHLADGSFVLRTRLTFCWSIRRILEGQELGNQAMTNFFQIPFLFPNAEKDRNF